MFQNQLVVSFLTLRKLIGILGLLLPILLLLGCCFYCTSCKQSSISMYYHSEMRDVFVGVICSISVFLFCYNGYEKTDRFASSWAGISAAGVAFFPTSNMGIPEDWISYLHYGCAISFFASLIYFNLFLFTLTSKINHPTANKLQRNQVFLWCGYIMLGSVISILAYAVVLKNMFPELINYNLVFWLESIALWAFGISWAVKGELILKDVESERNVVGQNIFNITILVEDYDDAIQFYTNKLGFKLLEDTLLDDGKRWVRVSPAGSKNPSLLLAKASSDAQRHRIGDQTGKRVFLFMQTDDIQRDYQRLKENQVHIIREPNSESYGTVLVFADLYGNMWDLIEPSIT